MDRCRVRHILTLIALLAAWWPLAATAAGRPRLVVTIVVDQFRADYLTTFASHWRAGFKTLLAEGAHFRRVQYPYLHTDTCAGHATISTGTLPRTHGMIADNWWDRELGEDLECTEDAAAKTITYGRPAKIGSSPKWLMAPTLADRLREQRPGARVVTLSLKARSAIALAGRAGDAVTWFEDAAGTFLTSSAFAPAPVAAVAQFIDRSPYEQVLDSTWDLRDAPSTYRNRDAGVGERPPTGWTGLFPHVLTGEKGADAQFVSQWRRSPFPDAYVGRLAAWLVDAYELGGRDATDYLGISFSAADYVGHAFGPSSRELEDAVARMDDIIGDLIAHLDRSVGRANYVLAVTSDHGVAPVPTSEGAGRVAPQDVRERIEETLRTRDKAPTPGNYVDANYLGNMYLAQKAKKLVASDPRSVRAIEDAVMAIPGVSRVLYTPALNDSTTDPLMRAAWLSSVPARSGDFVVVLRRNWVFGGRPPANAASHGSGYDYDRRVPLLLLGADVKPGVYDGPAAPTDIAPTLAVLAGISLPDAEGRVLREALASPAGAARR